MKKSNFIKTTIEKIIAPEANHLLTEPPNRPRHLGDFGWFCREHCIITHIVLKSLKYPVEMISGDISIFYPKRLLLTTTKTYTDEHWWCTSPEFSIIDISATLKHLPNNPFFLNPIIGVGSNGEFTIITTTANKHQHESHNYPVIIYSPFKTQRDLQIKPEAGFIAAAIAMHIIELIHEKTTSYQSISQKDALNEIAAKYPNAMADVSRIVQSC